MKKINKIIRQQSGQEKIETLLVIDSTTGQNGLEQARVFNGNCEADRDYSYKI